MQTTAMLNNVDLERQRENIKAITTQPASAKCRSMKGKIAFVTSLMLLLFSTAFSQEPQLAVKKIRLNAFSKININSDITVILIEDENENSARIEGSSHFVKKVALEQNGDEVKIKANGFKNINEKGAIYIPVRSLRQIEINADAKLISPLTLHIPRLDILVNGNCVVNVATNGQLNIRETEGFSFVQLPRPTGTESFTKSRNLNH